MSALVLCAVDDHAIETIEIASIDRSIQVRIKTDKSTVDDYHRALVTIAEAAQEPEKSQPRPFPPIVCFREPRTGKLYLADGNHRLESRIKNGETTIVAEVREGAKRNALEYAIGSSKGHGLRFSNADKRKAVTLAFKDSKLKKLSDNQLAALIGVSQPFVSKLKGELITVITSDSVEDEAPPVEVDVVERLALAIVGLVKKCPSGRLPELRALIDSQLQLSN